MHDREEPTTGGATAPSQGSGAPAWSAPATGPTLPPPVPPAAAPPLPGMPAGTPVAPPVLPPPPTPALGGHRRRWWIGGGIAVVAAVALAVGLIVVASGRDDSTASGPCPGADGRSRVLRECLSPSLAFVSTAYGSGSGVMIEGGYLVTNLHVVEPYAAADVTFTDGERHADVPVVGADVFDDIAVLGPIDTDRPVLSIEPQPMDEGTDEPDVFLVGFPGGVEDDEPAVTISGGLLSRLRTDDRLGLTYLQSDAAISGGQSGGALVDASGRLLGISGLGFAEEFALALSAADVRASIDRILAGDGDEYEAFGASPGDTDAVTFELNGLSPSLTGLIPAGDARRRVGLSVESDAPVAVLVSSIGGALLAANEALLGDESGGWYADAELLEEDRPGHYTFELPGGDDGIVYVTRLDRDTAVTVDADVALVVRPEVVDGGSITEGETRGVLQSLGSTAIHAIELEAGDVVVIELSAGSNDPYFTLIGPDESFDIDADPQVDDGGGGLFALDSYERFEIDRSGTWHIVLSTWDGYTTGYVLTVRID